MRRTLLLAVLTIVLQSPRSLLARQQPAAPVSTAQQVPPASVLTLVRQAQSSGSAGDWSEAARLWGRVVELNPVQPSWWYSLGDAYYRARDYKNAISAFEKAAELGAPMMGGYYSVYEIARSYALAGDTARAIQALERAFRLGFPNLGQAVRDPDLASIRQDPRVVEMLGLKDVSKMSRHAGWRYDLAILAGEVHRKGFNPELDVHRPVTREQFDAQVRELNDAIPRLTDGQVVLAMMKLMVLVGTAIRRSGISASTRCSAPRCRCGSSGSRRGCS